MGSSGMIHDSSQSFFLGHLSPDRCTLHVPIVSLSQPFRRLHVRPLPRRSAGVLGHGPDLLRARAGEGRGQEVPSLAPSDPARPAGLPEDDATPPPALSGAGQLRPLLSPDRAVGTGEPGTARVGPAWTRPWPPPGLKKSSGGFALHEKHLSRAPRSGGRDGGARLRGTAGGQSWPGLRMNLNTYRDREVPTMMTSLSIRRLLAPVRRPPITSPSTRVPQ